jgi:outer membrane protein TolC
MRVPKSPLASGLATVLLFASSFAFGQPAPQVLTLKAAVDQAIQSSPVLERSEAAVNQSRYDKYVSRSLLLPNVKITGSAAEQKDSVANRTPGTVAFGGESYNLYRVGIHAEQPLLAYGFFSAARQGRIREDISRKDLEISRRDVTRDVVDAYYATVMNENLVRILQDQEKAVKEILNISRRRMGLGGKRLDYLQSQTKLAVLVPQITKAKNSLASSTAELAQLMGLENTKTLTIGIGMPELSLKDVSPKLNLKQVDIPELGRVRLERESIGEEKSMSLGKSLPQLKIVGDYSFLNYTKAELFDSPSRSWTAAVVLDIPIFSGFSLINERRSLVAQEYQREAEERNIRNNLAVKQITSRASLETAEASLQSASEAVRLAKSAMAEARQNYSVGLIDFVQYSAVQDADFDAATTLLQTRYDAIKAYSDYFAASGQPLSLLVDMLSASEAKQ